MSKTCPDWYSRLLVRTTRNNADNTKLALTPYYIPNLRYFSFHRTSRGARTAPTTSRRYGCRCTPTAASAASTSPTGSTRKRSCQQSELPLCLQQLLALLLPSWPPPCVCTAQEYRYLLAHVGFPGPCLSTAGSSSSCLSRNHKSVKGLEAAVSGRGGQRGLSWQEQCGLRWTGIGRTYCGGAVHRGSRVVWRSWGLQGCAWRAAETKRDGQGRGDGAESCNMSNRLLVCPVPLHTPKAG